MTQLFTARRRLDVLDRLTTFFAGDQSIAGLVLVGSSTEATVDMYSGLDLLVVIQNGSVFPSVYRKWKQRLQELFSVAYEFEANTTINQASYSVMLEDYLEINLFFTPLKNLVAERDTWQVIFDHTASESIVSTLQSTYRTERIVGPVRVYQKMMMSIWQPIIKCVAAINRSEVWRALHMLEIIRQQTIELAALNHHIDTRHYAEVDQLPEMLLIQLRHTLPTSTDTKAIRRALYATTELFFLQGTIFEEQLQFKIVDKVYQKMKSYLDAYA